MFTNYVLPFEAAGYLLLAATIGALVLANQGICVIDELDKMTKEDRKRILESAPVGTFALMSVVIGGMVVAWLFLYYGVFLPRG